jgi:hypothetical protein
MSNSLKDLVPRIADDPPAAGRLVDAPEFDLTQVAKTCVSGWLRRKCSPSLRRSSEAKSMRTLLGGRERGAHEAPVLHPIVSAREAQRSEPDTQKQRSLRSPFLFSQQPS